MAGPGSYPTVSPSGGEGATWGSRGTRNWNASFSALHPGPGFRADAGFMNRVGVREANGFPRRTFHTPELDRATRFAVHASGRCTVDHDGELVSRAPARFDEPVPSDREGLFGPFLFSYEPNPRTALFAGSTDRRVGLETEGRTVALRQTERTFFLEPRYAWRT